MSSNNPFQYEEKRTFMGRFGFLFGVVAVIGIGAFVVIKMTSGKVAPVRKASDVVMVRPPVATPPPPPPPPPQQVPKQQVEEQVQVSEQDMKPAETPPEDNTPDIATGVAGNGPADGFGLGSKEKRRVGGSGGGGSGGSRFGGYFTSVVKAVSDALGRDPTTKLASGEIKLRVWADSLGRVNKVKLLGTTGDEVLDQAIRSRALIGCQLPEIPEGMRMPLELRVKLRRPN